MAAPKIKLTPKQMQIVAGAVVFLGAGGFVYFKYFWSPISERISVAKAAIEEVEGKIDKAKKQAARLPQIKKELLALQIQAENAEKRLPKSKDIPAVIDTLAAVARKSKVSLQNFAPNAPAAKQYFIEVPYAVTASGGFHDIGRFFAGIALEERIYSVRNVNFTGGTDGKINVSFTLIAYQYKG